MRGTGVFRAAAVLVVVTWGAYVCFWNLGSETVGGDEATYVRAGWQYVHGVFSANQEHPPTAKYLFGIAQLIGNQGALAPRVFVGSLVFAVAGATFLWVRRELGWWAGVAGAAMWLLTPRAASGLSRIDRVALLEPVMVAFAVLALLAAWVYARTERRWWAVVSAALMAASVTSKATTLVLLPVFLLVPILVGRGRPHLAAAALWVATFCLVSCVLYLPMGWSAVTFMVRFQSEHASQGHLVEVAGRVYAFPPWWADIWLMYDGMGLLTVVLLGAGCLAALWARPRMLVAYVATALALLVSFFVFLSTVSLSHYYYAWTPFLVILAATGFGSLGARLTPRWQTVIVLPVVFFTAIPAAQLSATVWNSHPTGAALVPGILHESGSPPGKVLIAGLTPSAVAGHLWGQTTRDPTQGPFVAVIIGTDSRYPPAEVITRFIERNPEKFTRYDLETMVLWVPQGHLVYDGSSFALEPWVSGVDTGARAVWSPLRPR